MNDFLDLEDLDDATIARLLRVAKHVVDVPRGDGLVGRVFGLLFFNPSLRTLASCQSAIGQLGGSSFVIQPGAGTWDLELESGVVMDGGRAEHIREALPVLESYCDVLGVRCFPRGESLDDDLSEPILSALRELRSKPLVNLESSMNHPCQALADWKTLDDLAIPAAGGRFVLSWAWHPKALPLAVPSAVLTMAARRGMDVTILRPDGFGLPRSIMERASRAASRSGGSVRETTDRISAMDGAHVLYAKSWTSTTDYGDAEADANRRETLRDWCVTESWFEGAESDARFMHCLPVRRNVIVEDAVLDGERSVVVQQAANRLPINKAVLLELLNGGPRP